MFGKTKSAERPVITPSEEEVDRRSYWWSIAQGVAGESETSVDEQRRAYYVAAMNPHQNREREFLAKHQQKLASEPALVQKVTRAYREGKKWAEEYSTPGGPELGLRAGLRERAGQWVVEQVGGVEQVEEQIRAGTLDNDRMNAMANSYMCGALDFSHGAADMLAWVANSGAFRLFDRVTAESPRGQQLAERTAELMHAYTSGKAFR